jgi:hypothetical protein
MHDCFVQHGTFERGERSTVVQICRQRFAPDALLEDVSKGRAPGFCELCSERLELGVRCGSLAKSADHVGEVAAMERS